MSKLCAEIERVCNKCKIRKPIEQYNDQSRNNGLKRLYCKKCQYQNQQRWRSINLDYYNKGIREKRRRFRIEMVNAYGGKCVCCGETEIQFLSLDHINGGGEAERKKFFGPSGVLAYLKSRGWPTDKYQILCHNCNMSKGFYGECPHMRKLVVENS